MLYRADNVQSSQWRWAVVVCVLFVSLVALWGCEGGDAPPSVPILKDGAADVAVVYSNKAGEGVKEAAEELVRVLSEMTGQSFAAAAAIEGEAALASRSEGVVIVVGTGLLSAEIVSAQTLSPLGDEGYAMTGKRAAGKLIYQIAGNTEVGHQYGVYALLRSWGVRYFHQSDTYTPKKSDITLSFAETIQDKPEMGLRGFHHHTQHPIPMSVFLLEPDEKHLPRVKEYMTWMTRNRQNLLQWHMLKTIDVEKWLPYIKKVHDMAVPRGIKLAMVLSFADQQQNNYRLIDNLDTSKEEQNASIKQRLDKLLEGGFDLFVFQYGTSEFTKVGDDITLNWLNTAAAHMKSRNKPAFAWIHIAGNLRTDDGKGYFYHLPEKADTAMGAYVHTTMFYDMRNPAPVYDNEDFTHQKKFLDRVLGKREVVFFPESAWWLGFDVNLPLALPITGYSRALDLLDITKGQALQGHVTFTSGMEWGYWKYDHYLTRVTWDRATTWEAYIKDFASTFGKAAAAVEEVMKKWTDNQVRDFYKDNPLHFFYLAGELAQDELGQQAGVIARRPKRSFVEIVNLKEEDYAKWEKDDFAKLQQMEKDYSALLAKLPEKLDGVTNPTALKLYDELRTTYKLYVWRIQHTIALYDSVRQARLGRKDGGVGAAGSDAEKDKALQAAEDRIKEAKAISEKVKLEVARFEKEIYRYPKELVATERPNLTSYPFGYLWETSTAHFWTRRDAQAEKLLKRVSGELKEEWKPVPSAIFYADVKDIELAEPDNPLIKQVLKPFIPGFFVAANTDQAPDGSVTDSWLMAIDGNANKLPDTDTISTIDKGEIKTENGVTTFTGQIKLYQLPVIDKEGNDLGLLLLNDAELTYELERDGDTLKAVKKGELKARVLLDNLIKVAMNVAGLDRDGLLQLLSGLLKFDPKNPPKDIALKISLNAFTKL